MLGDKGAGAPKSRNEGPALAEWVVLKKEEKGKEDGRGKRGVDSRMWFDSRDECDSN